VIAWEAGRDPERAHLAVANLTGAIRLLLGLGWPMIYFTFAFFGRGRAGRRLPRIRLEREHATEVAGLVPPLLYFVVIVVKGTITWIDAVVLCALYAAYLYVLLLHPPHAEEALSDAPRVTQWAYRQRGWRRRAAVGAPFAGGGLLLYVSAHPFLESTLAVAAVFGVSQFVLVQWVAPFLSEFPEKISAFKLGPARHPRADGPHEHGLEQHQSVDRARGDDPTGVRALTPAPSRRLGGLRLRRRATPRDRAHDAADGPRRHAARQIWSSTGSTRPPCSCSGSRSSSSPGGARRSRSPTPPGSRSGLPFGRSRCSRRGTSGRPCEGTGDATPRTGDDANGRLPKTGGGRSPQPERRGLLKPERNHWSLTAASVVPAWGHDIGHSIRVHDRACWLNN
jgi:hypothetical protein